MNSIPTVWRHSASLLLLAGLLGLAAGSGESDSPGGGGTTQTPSPTGERRVSGDSWYGCKDREYHSKLTQYAVQKDSEAFKRALAAGLLTGQCTAFKAGETVYVADTAIFSGLVKVRRRGQTDEFWTNIEAVK